MGTTHADAGRPTILNGVATPEERYIEIKGQSRAISLRNLGTETLWCAVTPESDGADQEPPPPPQWFDIASGTSWGSHAVVSGFWCCTQLGETTFVVNSVDLDLC